MKIIPTLLAVLGCCLTAQAVVSKKPNILFLLSDDHSAPWLGCYGTTNVTTPNLDRMASQGMLFNRFFCVAPQCVPSRAGMMTGRSAVSARMTRFSAPLPMDVVTFPEVLRNEGGYYTGVCGRTFHLDGAGRTTDNAVIEHYGLKTFAKRMDFVEKGSQLDNPARLETFLDRVPAEKPFFLWINYSDPHHPWEAKEFQHDPKSLKLPGYFPDTPAMRESFAAYLGEIDRLDGMVGDVFKVLEKRGLMDNTIIVFVGDNGMALPHGKGSLYDPGLNTPLIVRWPGIVRPGGATDALISGEDFGPTLLAAAGLKAPECMTGHNFLPLLRAEAYQPRKHIFAERGVHGTAVLTPGSTSNGLDFARVVRSDRYKLIYNFTYLMPYSPVDSGAHPYWQEMIAANAAGTLAAPLAKTYFSMPRPIYELYDMQSDPDELNNLAGTPAVAEIEKDLKVALVEKMVLDWDYLPLPDMHDDSVGQTRRGDGKQKGGAENPPRKQK